MLNRLLTLFLFLYIGDEEMPLSDFLAAEVAMYESFPGESGKTLR